MPKPWELIIEADQILTEYLARTGSMDKSLLEVLARIRIILEGYDLFVAQEELSNHQSPLH